MHVLLCAYMHVTLQQLTVGQQLITQPSCCVDFSSSLQSNYCHMQPGFCSLPSNVMQHHLLLPSYDSYQMQQLLYLHLRQHVFLSSHNLKQHLQLKQLNSYTKQLAPEAAGDGLEQSFLIHFRQMNLKEDWVEEVLLDLRVVLESKELEIQRLRRNLQLKNEVLLLNNKQVSNSLFTINQSNIITEVM